MQIEFISVEWRKHSIISESVRKNAIRLSCNIKYNLEQDQRHH